MGHLGASLAHLVPESVESGSKRDPRNRSPRLREGNRGAFGRSYNVTMTVGRSYNPTILQCTLYIVHCAVQHIVHCTLYIVRCTLYIVQYYCTLYIVQSGF